MATPSFKISKKRSPSSEVSSDIANNINEIINSYTIQLIEERKRKDNELELQYYFDSRDMVNIIQGAFSYVTNNSFNSIQYKKDRYQNLVYGFAYQGIYKPTPIKMLSPHKIEFINQLYPYPSSLKFHSIEDFQDVVNDVLYLLDGKIDTLNFDIKSSNLNDKVLSLIHNSTELFRMNYLLRNNGKWKARLEHIITNDIFSLVPFNEEFPEIVDDNLFKTISTGFEKARPTGGKNNFYDSLAFYQLQEMLDKHENDKSIPLPVFYASSSTINRAIKIIQNIDNRLFSYKSDEIRERIPIVRDAMFFVLEPIFTLNDSTEEYFNDLRKYQPIIRSIMDTEYSKAFSNNRGIKDDFRRSKQRFRNNIRELIDVRFTQEIWIKNKIHENLVDEIKTIMSSAENYSPEIEEEIQKQLDKILKDAHENLERSRLLGLITDSFRTIERDVNLVFRQNSLIGGLDVFRDFALVKFGIDNRKLPDLQYIINAFVQHENPINEASPALYNILRALSLKIDSQSKAKKFLSGIVICWLFGKYNLIIELCSKIGPRDLQNRYETAIIYGAAMLAYKRDKTNIKNVEHVINCILSKKDLNYKVWIGISYIYQRIWEIENKVYPELPEMRPKTWSKSIESNSYEKYFQNGSLYYATEALNYLKQKLEEDGPLYQDYFTYYLYVLNNVIYYICKSGTEEQFLEITDMVKELKSHELNSSSWQGRFYDTLGWYSLRRSFYISERKFKNIYINQAKVYLDKARSYVSSHRDLTLFNQLEDAYVSIHL